MKILITSGGTKVPIDRVRDITNQSNGTFGSKIATEALRRGHETIFLCAEKSKSPFTLNVDVTGGLSHLEELRQLYESVKYSYHEFLFRNYSDYAGKLRNLIINEKPDAVVLAAAVSDYGVANFVDGKIRTKDNLTIQLEPLPKLIGKVKEWHPKTFLVGFKLLVGSTKQELIDAAYNSIQTNGCDFVVANDWESFLSGEPEIHIVDKDKVETYKSNYLEHFILDKISSCRQS